MQPLRAQPCAGPIKECLRPIYVFHDASPSALMYVLFSISPVVTPRPVSLKQRRYVGARRVRGSEVVALQVMSTARSTSRRQHRRASSRRATAVLSICTARATQGSPAEQSGNSSRGVAVERQRRGRYGDCNGECGILRACHARWGARCAKICGCVPCGAIVPAARHGGRRVVACPPPASDAGRVIAVARHVLSAPGVSRQPVAGRPGTGLRR